MKSRFCFLVLTVLLIGAGAVLASTQAEIAAANAEWVKQYNAGNAAGVAALYAEDAKLLPPNSDFVSGKEGITSLWQGLMDSGGKSATLNVVEVMGSGNTAVEVGTYEVMGADGKVMDKGKYMVHWKKVGSSWKLHRDIWNSSMPAPSSETK